MARPGRAGGKWGGKPRALPWAGRGPRRWRSIWWLAFSSYALICLDQARLQGVLAWSWRMATPWRAATSPVATTAGTGPSPPRAGVRQRKSGAALLMQCSANGGAGFGNRGLVHGIDGVREFMVVPAGLATLLRLTEPRSGGKTGKPGASLAVTVSLPGKPPTV